MTYPTRTEDRLATLTITAALTLAGCSDHDMGTMTPSSSAPPASSPSASTSAAAEFNDADVMFVQLMLPHHEQAVTMSDTLLAKSGVTTWGQQEMGGMGGMTHASDDGMATAAQLKDFGQADGQAGQKTYLRLMTAHHQGAIRMAESEVNDGKNPDAIALAKTIITTQQQEVGVMKDLLGTL